MEGVHERRVRQQPCRCPSTAGPWDRGGGGLRGSWYVAGGLHDANGSPTEWGFTTFFDVREYYTWIETGWSPGREIMSGIGVHVNAWHQDARTEAVTPESWGVTASASKEIAQRWTPFLRADTARGVPRRCAS